MFSKIKNELLSKPLVWLITGAAGFIGSNILEQLLKLNQTVIGMDNLSTGSLYNINMALSKVSPDQAKRFDFIQGDILDISNCKRCCGRVDIILHHAALGSVTLSLEDPVSSHRINVDGFVNMLIAARDAKVKRFIYALGESISLNQLFYLISEIIKTKKPDFAISNPLYSDFRPGDVRHSLSDISKAKKYLDYRPTNNVRNGLKEYINWFVENSV